MNKPTQFFVASLITGSLIILLLAGCNGVPVQDNGNTASITPSFYPIEEMRTAEPTLTSIPTQLPTFTSRPTDTQPASTMTPEPTRTAIPPSQTPTAENLCNRASPGFPRIDVEIDDDSIMFPGERFTKVWRLVNSGTCTWTPDYKAVWFFGANLGDSVSVLLRESVAPGESIDIMVDMTAPTDAGTYQSNWKLQDESGQTFGIGPTGSSPFWVRIVVIHTPTPTFSPSPAPTATPTPSETPIPTPTPPVRLTGTAELEVGDRIDLDVPQVNPESGEDLEYQVDDLGGFWLRPAFGAFLGVHGESEPSYLTCQETPLSGDPVELSSLGLGTYICFQTDQGYPGWLLLEEIHPETHTISIMFLVWEKLE
jgi:hypothetical protein